MSVAEPPDLAAALELATAAAREAGELIRAEFHREGGPRRWGRQHADVDREAEVVIRGHLRRAFPGFNYVGEETGIAREDPSAPTWFVDPHDGTRAFLEGWRGSAVSIGLVVEGLPVLGVVHAPCAPTSAGDLFTWAEGQPVHRNGKPAGRRSCPDFLNSTSVILLGHLADHSAAANAACCAPARFRAVPSIAYRCALVAVDDGDVAVCIDGPMEWQYVAGHALLRGVRGDLVDHRGRPIRYDASGSGALRVLGGSLQATRKLARRRWETTEVRPRSRQRVRPATQRVPSPEVKVADPGLLDRAQGVLLGQVTGDALGAQVALKGRGEIRLRYGGRVCLLLDGGDWKTLAGQPTDGSELALTLARALLGRGTFDGDALRKAYAGWLASRPFDVGSTTRAGLSGKPDPESQANEALKRISPLGVFACSCPPEVVGAMAREEAALTHPSPICRDASAAYCVAISQQVRTGRGAAFAWQSAIAWCEGQNAAPAVLEALVAAETQKPRSYEHNQAWVLTALQNAFYQALNAPSAERGIIDSVSEGGDADTNGAVAGALLGAVHGAASFPNRWSPLILSCRPMRSRRKRPPEYWPVDVMVLAEALLVVGKRAMANGALGRKVVPLYAKRAWKVAYEKSVESAASQLEWAAGELLSAGLDIAFSREWREWDAAHPAGAPLALSTDHLLAAQDPSVRAVGRAVEALEEALEVLEASSALGGRNNGSTPSS